MMKEMWEYTEDELRAILFRTYNRPSHNETINALLYGDEDEIARLRLLNIKIRQEVDQKVAEYLPLNREGRIALLGSITHITVEPTPQEIAQEKTRLQEAENAKIDARIAANRP